MKILQRGALLLWLLALGQTILGSTPRSTFNFTYFANPHISLFPKQRVNHNTSITQPHTRPCLNPHHKSLRPNRRHKTGSPSLVGTGTRYLAFVQHT